ncbi:hypothetical protein OsI_10129 [Oryza sativa Indica Group]|uniref:3-ketoacyl-CoA synthase n=1 Tax=Oryza sativa subsp. indica TaxID=39946 RepID=A2XCU5_ORYSI|nr:hypothetical protein OsI_10129 [Oryza sativa Indica Group]
MDSRELLRTVTQAARNHARTLYHRLVGRHLPRILAVTLLLAAARAGGAATTTLDALARENARALVAVACCCAAAAYAYAMSRPRPVYLVDLAGYKPAASHEATRAESIRRFGLAGDFTGESMAFQRRMMERSGLGEATHFPASLFALPVDMCLRTAREESEAVVFGAVDELLAKTGVPPADVGVVIVNSSLFSPTPSFTSLVVHAETYALVVSTENITLNAYMGNYRPMLVTNTLFRMGGAAVLLSNRRAERRRAKYQLMHTVRTHRGGASDRSYACVTQEEDGAGNVGVSLSKELMSVAGDALRTNITTLGPLVLPLSEQLRFLATVVLRRVFGHAAGVKPYLPDFTAALDHFCIHAGGRGVLDELERSLKLSAWHMEPSRMTLYRFGNTSSSSLWYELSYCEAKGRIRRGDRVWQIAFGSGFKCNSAVWKALRTVDSGAGRDAGAWAQDIDALPVHVPKVVPIVDDDDGANGGDGDRHDAASHVRPE